MFAAVAVLLNDALIVDLFVALRAVVRGVFTVAAVLVTVVVAETVVTIIATIVTCEVDLVIL